MLCPPSSAHGFDVFLEVSYIKGQAGIGLKSGFWWVLFSEWLTAQCHVRVTPVAGIPWVTSTL